MPALIFPSKTMPPPHIGPTVAAAGFLRPLLESKAISMWICLGWRWNSQQPTERDEMALFATALLEGAVAPKGDKFGNVGGRGHQRRVGSQGMADNP